MRLSAELRDHSGAQAGTVWMELPGAFATQDRPQHLLPHRTRHRGGLLRPANIYPLRWRIVLARGPARSGLIVYRPGVAHAGTTVAILCRPCDSGATGEIALTRGQAALLLNGQLAFRFQGDDGELRGPFPGSNNAA